MASSRTSPWSRARDAWLERALAALAHDERVVRVELVGSFGRGEADEWSDVDLLVVVGDDHHDDWVRRNELWDGAALRFAAPQNTRATAASAGTLHVVDGMPVGVDWYVYRASEGDRPTGMTFDDWNEMGPRGTPARFTDGEIRLAHVSMVVILGKQVARGERPATELDALVSQVRRDAPPHLRPPLLAYLAEVGRHLGQ